MRAKFARFSCFASYRPRARLRRGATMIEFAIVMTIFLMLVLGMLDLGMAVFRSHVLSHAARQGVRAAIVRGEYSVAALGGPLGPTAISGTAASDNPIATAVLPHLVGMSPSDVTVNVTWPDGNNEVESDVSVELTTNYTPMTTFVFGSPTWSLSASSTMPIAH